MKPTKEVIMYSTTLCLNTLLEYRLGDGKTRIERILWIDPLGDPIVTIDINRKNKHALPIWKTRGEIESALETAVATIIDDDPWAALLHPNANFSEEREKVREVQEKMRQEHRDRAWNAIELLVKDKDGKIFDPRQRGPLIASHTRKKGDGE